MPNPHPRETDSFGDDPAAYEGPDVERSVDDAPRTTHRPTHENGHEMHHDDDDDHDRDTANHDPEGEPKPGGLGQDGTIPNDPDGVAAGHTGEPSTFEPEEDEQADD